VTMCNVLKVSKSGYYKWLRNQDQEETENERKRNELKEKIRQIFYQRFETYGAPRIHDELIDEGYVVSRKTVGRLMKEMGLRAIPEEKYVVTTDSNHDLLVYPNLLNQKFTVEEPNKVWVTDITYIRTLEGWVYLASVIDLFSRKVVGWKMADHMKKELPLAALKMAITLRQPDKGLIHHSDRGSQYCSKEYIDELNELQADISMSRTGNPYDNACIESFHATIKKEWIYRRRFNTRVEAIKSINYYISHFYNQIRKHSTLGYCSPNQFEKLYFSNQNELLIC
jgi:putative transposase